METIDDNIRGYPHWTTTGVSPGFAHASWSSSSRGPPSPIERPARRRESRGSQVDHAGRPISWLDEVGNPPNTKRRVSTGLGSSQELPAVTLSPQSQHNLALHSSMLDPSPFSRGPGSYGGFNLALHSPEISKDLLWEASGPQQSTLLSSDGHGIQNNQAQTGPLSIAKSPQSLRSSNSLDPYSESVKDGDRVWPISSFMTGDGSYHSVYSPETSFLGESPIDARRGSKIGAFSSLENKVNNNPSFTAPVDIQYAVVEFKIWRSEVYTFRKSTMELERGAAVIVEADRGEDLGIIVGIFVNRRDAEEYKVVKLRKNYGTLISYSKQPFPEPEALEMSFREYYKFNSTSPQATGDPKRGTQKAILRLANRSEIALLRNKEGLEERAKRTCAQKIREFKYPMEVVDAELQIDHKKLTYYTLSDEYVNFSPMVTELFKIFKFRIWISVLNPAATNSPQLTPRYHGSISSQGNAFSGAAGKPAVAGAEMYSRHLHTVLSSGLAGSSPLGPIAAPRIPSTYSRSGGTHAMAISPPDLDRYLNPAAFANELTPMTSGPWNDRHYPTSRDSDHKILSPGTPHSAISSGSTKASSRKSTDYDDLIASTFGSLNLNR